MATLVANALDDLEAERLVAADVLLLVAESAWQDGYDARRFDFESHGYTVGSGHRRLEAPPA